MKKTLLFLFLCASVLAPFKASAQDPYTLDMFENFIFYGMYEATVSEPIPAGAVRHSNSSYGKMLTQDQLDSFGNTLTMTVTLNPLCDNYDRIGNVNLALVPKGQTTYVYNQVKRVEIGRFITPFMDKNDTSVTEVPYVYDLNHLTNLFHNTAITELYDFWIELEVYGYQGGPGQGGAAVEIPGCAGRNDVYMGSLTFDSTTDESIVAPESSFIVPMSYKYEMKDYTLDGTDELDETVRSIYVTLDAPAENAQLHLVMSNHGSGTNGEEYVRREHFVYFDDELKLQYKPGGLSCIPYIDYNTQINCIYYRCDLAGTPPRADTNAAWSWNNWCPGNKIPNRVIDLGNVAAGTHTYKIDVPSAVFYNNDGYFPMSVYMTGDGFNGVVVLGQKDFLENVVSVYPNPVNDIVNITADNQVIKAVTVTNTLGQTVYTGTTDKVDMSKLQTGIYIVRVDFDNNQSVVKKIMKK
jgi:hypothetical protein